jgi:hypothetical protein
VVAANHTGNASRQLSNDAEDVHEGNVLVLGAVG